MVIEREKSENKTKQYQLLSKHTSGERGGWRAVTKEIFLEFKALCMLSAVINPIPLFPIFLNYLTYCIVNTSR